MVDDIGLARDRRARGQWRQACDSFLAEEARLGADDLESLAVCAFLVGRDAASDRAWERAYRLRTDAGDRVGAARCAFWLAFRLLNAGEGPLANGWIARLERLLLGWQEDSLEHARLAYLTGLQAAFESDLPTAETALSRSAELASRHGDLETAALAQLWLGRVLIFRGAISPGVRLLDEAMLAVRSEALSPAAVGDSYCTAIDACRDLFDVRRGLVWTEGLSRWCEGQPELVPFAGVCLVHRSEFLQLKGAWGEAMEQVDLARARLAQPSLQPAFGAAVYQQGELHRLRGELDVAEQCYREAARYGRDPQPGLALLRLSQGRTADAAQAIDRALAEAAEPVERWQLLAAYVEIMLGNDRTVAAGTATAELSEVAGRLGSPLLDAVTRRAEGSVLLAEGDPRGALTTLRRAADGFRACDTPYEAARTSVLIGRARSRLGDQEGARDELDAARSTFVRLGAKPDLARLDADAPAALTARELQVLRLVARGATNRQIGTELRLSERTVDRHVSNIFSKLGVSSRAAATALAYETELL